MQVWAECADHVVEATFAPLRSFVQGDVVQVRHAGLVKSGTVVRVTPSTVTVTVPNRNGHKDIVRRIEDVL